VNCTNKAELQIRKRRDLNVAQYGNVTLAAPSPSCHPRAAFQCEILQGVTYL